MLPNFIKNWDRYGVIVPQFNIKGQEAVKTSPGAILSIFIIIVTALFALLKLGHLQSRKSPTVTKFVQE